MTKPPQNVMRFYGNLQYALECIAFKQVTFLHIDKLNDPFDPYLSFETDFNEDYQALINYIPQHHKKDFQKFKNCLPKENWESSLKGMKDYFKNLVNNTFVFSTCGITEGTHPKDNLYMWSHYGNGHRGVAIEFDTTILERAVLEQQKRLGGPNLDDKVLFEITYQDEIPKITCEHIFDFVINCPDNPDKEALDQTEIAKTLRKILFSKSIEWKIEREWRLMWRNDETKLKILRLDLLDETITAVYLGCRYPLADRKNDDFIFETKRNFPRAEIFKAKERKGKFALDFERISLR